jgi:hypothetical protein
MTEGTLATAFTKAMVVAIADLMDDGSSQGRKTDETQEKETTMALESSQKPTQTKSIQRKSSSSSYCSPYDTLYWLGGDCLSATTATTMATIAECATMKTDNTTTEMATANKNVLAIVSPSNSSSSSSSTNSIRGNEENLAVLEDQNFDSKDTNDSISSNEMNTNANADIIFQYHQQYPTEVDPIDRRRANNSKSLFTDYAAANVDYNDPMNSILVEDHDRHTDFSKNYSMNPIISGSSKKNDRKSKIQFDYFRKYNRKSNQSNRFFCSKNTYSISETEEEDWFSASSSSPASWCGGYPSLLMYDHDDNDDDDTQGQKQQQSEEKLPDYYADFKPQRQFAFDEEDSEFSGSALTPTNRAALVDGTADEAATTNTNDGGGSVQTNVSSVQSFMVINRPHINASIPSTSTSTRLTEKLERNNSKSSSSRRITPERRGYHHLHKLIASPGASRTGSGVTNSDSDSVTNNNSLEYALTQSLMRKLQKHLPYGKRGDSFWLQYSLLRDGASLDSLVEMVQRDTNKNSSSSSNNNICSVLAIETVEGEVFGAFLTQTWRRSYRQWFGGGQSFLWTTENSSRKGTTSKDKNLKVFPYSFENSYVQLCDRDRLLVGGGDGGDNYERHSYGFGLALESDLLRGSSCPCTTFLSPSLSKLHSDGSTFEIRNLEVWTLTPCLSMVDNPSQGRVRVHKRDETATRKTKKKDKTKAAVAAATATKNEHNTITISDEIAAENDDSYQDFYNCSHPDCQGIETTENDTEEGIDLGVARSFPGVPRHNSQRHKHRNRYVCPSASL